MITNADITIYNRKYDEKTKFNTWHRTLIRGVHVYVDHKVSRGESGVNGSEVCKIRIPADVEAADLYLTQEQYAVSKAASRHWTIRNEDYIVLGDCQGDIERPADLKNTQMRYYRIMSWSDNRFGGLPHWRIGGE